MELVKNPTEEADHHPGPNDDESWQESFAFAWFDPAARIGGWHHLGFQRPRGIIDYVSWVAIDGAIVHNYQNPAHPIPDCEIRNMNIGPLRAQLTVPLRSQKVTIADKGINAELNVEAITGPFYFGHYDAKSHWESYNQVSGSIDTGGERRDIRALAFLNRSWGPRNMAKILSCRYLFACFGADLTLRLFIVTTAEGTKSYGFAATGGKLVLIRRVEMNALMSIDGISATGVEIKAWTEGGHGYTFRGQADSSAPSAPVPDFFYSHSNMIFTAGERLGAGYLQVRELQSLAPWQRKIAGMD